MDEAAIAVFMVLSFLAGVAVFCLVYFLIRRMIQALFRIAEATEKTAQDVAFIKEQVKWHTDRAYEQAMKAQAARAAARQ